jgi:ketosteroid isomerase-like protein
MTHHEHPNVTVVREGFAAFERGDMARMDQLLADDVMWHIGGNSKWAGTYQGKQQVLELVLAVSDLQAARKLHAQGSQ